MWWESSRYASAWGRGCVSKWFLPLYFNFYSISPLQAYGIVWKAIEKRSRVVIALKKCFDAFRNATDAQRTFREIMYLQVLLFSSLLCYCSCWLRRRLVVTRISSDYSTWLKLRMIAIFIWLLTTWKQVRQASIPLSFCPLTPPLNTTNFADLHAVIRAGILADIHKKYIIWQLLKALKYLHSADLLHRDIKPSNILLNSDCHIKVCDFGLCRSIAETAGPAPVLTDYVATRWYRAPGV